MISHERKPSPGPRGGHGYSHPQHGHSSHYPAKPHTPEDTLKSEEVHIERKTFVFTLKENERGRFLRITEDVNGRRDTIIIPATGLADFKRLLETMVTESEKTPEPPEPPKAG